MRFIRLPWGTIIVLGLLAAGLFAGNNWLKQHPQHSPWAPLDLRDPPGMATASKLAAIKSDPAACQATLERSGIAFTALPDAGEGECRRSARTVLDPAEDSAALYPNSPATTCAVAAGYQLWLQHGLQPAARQLLGSEIATIEHLGAYNCRRIGGGQTGRWSEHATGNAIDIAAFVLEDGRRISVLRDWEDGSEKGIFLRQARDEACRAFGTVLSPEYNAAHRDHFHLDQAERGFGGVCR
ncbi:extensin [Altererythrobacter xixiisoli]|uniref:Extensin n=1 Tax=Croceibacterium xixiisoli TaxID=1476466 RepID=A0A6I4TPR1_9SPHN|nr:extensin family protein [Croceibacterium xixiisoli]MXO98135.1 extensin [Croceibacterium xixiisoli]